MWLMGLWPGAKMQDAKWEGLAGCRILPQACNLDGLGMLAWMVVLDLVRVWDYAGWYSICYQQTVFFLFGGCVFLFVLFITETVFVLCVMGQKNVSCYQWICFYLWIYVFRFCSQFSLLVVLFLSFFFSWEMRESMFCAPFLSRISRKTNLLDSSDKIGT